MILVDSDVLIAHLRGVQAARDWLLDARRDHGPLAASMVTVTEIQGGMRSAERHEVRSLLARLRLFDVDHPVAVQAAHYMRRYRRSHSGIGLGDYLIAGTCQVHNLELSTLNVRHFPMVPGLSAPFSLA